MNKDDPPRPQKSPVVKCSVVIGQHKTSISLEEEFWAAIKEIALKRHITLRELIAKIDQDRTDSNLSSAVRVFVLLHYQSKMKDAKPKHQL